MQFKIDFDNIRLVHVQKERDNLLKEVEKLKRSLRTVKGWYTRKNEKTNTNTYPFKLNSKRDE